MDKDIKEDINNLELLIEEAYKNNIDPIRLHNILNLIYSKIDLRNSTLKIIDIGRLNKISIKANKIETLFCIGLIYNLIFAYQLINIDTLNTQTLLNTMNVLILIQQHIHGTILYNRITHRIHYLLMVILKRNDIDHENKQHINNLVKNQINLNEFDQIEIIKEVKKFIKSKISLEKANGLIKLMDFFSTCPNLEDQLEIFTKESVPIFKEILLDTADKTKDLLMLLTIVLEMMIYQTEYLIKIPKSHLIPHEDHYESNNVNNLTEKSVKSIDSKLADVVEEGTKTAAANPNDTENIIKNNDDNKDYHILVYKLYDQERILKQYDVIYSIIGLFINTFLLYPKLIEIQRINIIILQRLYYLFPKYRKHLEEPIITVFSYIHEDPNEINKKEASIFLYRLIHRDADLEFKAIIESKQNLFNSLYSTPYYDPSIIANEVNEIEAIDLSNLNIKPGFPQSITIEAGKTYNQIVEVWKPYSILFWSINPHQFDINISLRRIAKFDKLRKNLEDNQEVYFENKKISVGKYPSRGYLLVIEPGLYQIEFDNSASWFNSKLIKYRFLVLNPCANFEKLFHINNKDETEVLSLSQIDIDNILNVNIKPIQENIPVNTYSKDNMYTNDIECLLYFQLNNLEISIANIDKTYEYNIQYDEDNIIIWAKINDKMNEIMGKIIDNLKNGQRINIKIIFNEYAFEKSINHLLNKDIKEPEETKELSSLSSSITTRNQSHYHHHHNIKMDYNQHFLNNLGFISKIKKYLVSIPKILPEMECVLNKFASEPPFASYTQIFIICINHDSKKIYGRLVKDLILQQYFKIEIDDIVIPIIENNQIMLKNISTVFFERQNIRDQLNILASLVINIYVMLGKYCSQFAIFENIASLLPNQEKAKELDDIIDEYISTMLDFKPKKTDDNNKPLNVIVAKVDFKHYAKFTSV